MQVTAQQLNAVASLLNTTDKNLVISMVIRSMVHDHGVSVKEAVDAVFGEGGYEKLSSEVYDMLKAPV